MVEYRCNPAWDVMFFKNINPNKLKSEIEGKVRRGKIGDIEVIDTQMTSYWDDYNEEVVYNILVFYRPLPIQEKPSTSEVTIVS